MAGSGRLGRMSLMLVPSLIERKRDGDSLSAGEWAALVRAYGAGEIPDYQMAALLMAVVWRGLSATELTELTTAMLESGDQLRFDGWAVPRVDKHSTGGVGDKTSLILAPMVACCGVAVPMMSGRGLGHTGGTLDKLESIPGFSTQLPLRVAETQVRQLGCALFGQTPEIAPIDRRLYALAGRDRDGAVRAPHRRQHHVEEAGRRARRAGAGREDRERRLPARRGALPRAGPDDDRPRRGPWRADRGPPDRHGPPAGSRLRECPRGGGVPAGPSGRRPV